MTNSCDKIEALQAQIEVLKLRFLLDAVLNQLPGVQALLREIERLRNEQQQTEVS